MRRTIAAIMVCVLAACVLVGARAWAQPAAPAAVGVVTRFEHLKWSRLGPDEYVRLLRDRSTGYCYAMYQYWPSVGEARAASTLGQVPCQ